MGNLSLGVRPRRSLSSRLRGRGWFGGAQEWEGSGIGEPTLRGEPKSSGLAQD